MFQCGGYPCKLAMWENNFLSFWFSKKAGVVFIKSGIISYKGWSLLAVSFIPGEWHVCESRTKGTSFLLQPSMLKSK